MSIATSLRTGPYIEDDESLIDITGNKSILKFKENILKHKCNKSLKKKLKQYKLRKDGQEDPQIIEISQSFHKFQLKLSDQSLILDTSDEIINSENYIIKMVRKKQISALLNKVNGKCKKKGSNSKTSDHNKAEDVIPLDKIDKIQKNNETNAFKLLMDSRNKVIGSNSPGKDREVNSPDLEEINQKKILKAKRNLALQKIAEGKGSVQKKFTEEQQNEYVKWKMDKRADRLKTMITKCGKIQKNSNVKETVTPAIDVKIDKISTDMSDDSIFYEKSFKNAETKIIKKDTYDKLGNKTLLNNDSNKTTDQKNLINCKLLISPKINKNDKDEDFLSKLSPSLKKKENMLCYFKKVDKDPEPVILTDDESKVQDSIPMVLKVKVVRKNNKKNTKKKKHTGHVDSTLPDQNLTVEIKYPIEDTRRKRKRKDINIEGLNNLLNHTCQNQSSTMVESRPKRNMKKPVKYVDDAQLSSSDEDLHIFTPKKKKYMSSSNNESSVAQKAKDSNKSNVNSKERKSLKLDTKLKKSCKENTKLAPIFVGKSHVDVAALEAKQKFLQSGIPDQLKKAISQQNTQTIIANSFYAVVHVQQNNYTLQNILRSKSFNLTDLPLEEPVIKQEIDIKNMLCLNQTPELKGRTIFKQDDIQSTLQYIKESYPNFPVYRTYKTLCSKRKGENKDFNCINLDNSSDVLNNTVDTVIYDPDYLSWTDKYKATSTKHIIGNFESNSELKKWLISWSEDHKSSKNCNKDSESDSDFCNSDEDSRDNRSISNNLLILSGPAGCGKTTSVYAVALELAMKVIEVNVSSRRSGKILLQDLQEATQSHKVNRGKGSSVDNSQETIGSVNPRKKKRLKNKLKSSPKHIFVAQSSESPAQMSQDARTAMSLILIDDADIVFEQDDGFISAIAQLVQCSKIPVILVTTSVTCSHLQKFLLCSNIIKMNPLLPKMLGTWLDIMCLSDTGVCWPGTGEKFLDFYKGDMRRTINCLQFYAFSETQRVSQTNSLKNQFNMIDFVDENSSISWVDKDCSEVKNQSNAKYNLLIQNGIWSYFVGNANNKMYLEYPIDLINVWWSVPDLAKDIVVEGEQTNSAIKNPLAYKKIQELSDVLDSISFADCMSFNIKPDTRSNISSNPWYCSESNSVSERQTLEDVNTFYEVSYNISHHLVKNSIDILNKSNNFQDTDTQFPGLLELRKRDKIIARHEILSNVVNLHSSLDRKAVAMDYWSTCRNICRIEKNKTDNHSKRNNRFFHYLKSSKVMCKNDVFDKLCNSLKPDEEI